MVRMTETLSVVCSHFERLRSDSVQQPLQVSPYYVGEVPPVCFMTQKGNIMENPSYHQEVLVDFSIFSWILPRFSCVSQFPVLTWFHLPRLVEMGNLRVQATRAVSAVPWPSRQCRVSSWYGILGKPKFAGWFGYNRIALGDHLLFRLKFGTI